MTCFYVLLYHFAVKRYNLKSKLIFWVYFLAIIRIVLCLLPQNQWQAAEPPLNWAIYRNIPFAILGVLTIILFYLKSKDKKDQPFIYLWFALLLSFAFYIPVVLFADVMPVVGILMIPKTVAYVWIVFMGWKALKKSVYND